MAKPTLLIIGVGPATGAAFCRQVAGKYRLALVARSRDVTAALAQELPDCTAYVGDISQRDTWPDVLQRIVAECGLPSRVLINTESAAWGNYNQLDLEQFATSFDVNATGFLQTIQMLFGEPANIPEDTRCIVSSSPAAFTPPARMLGLAPSRVAQRVMAELLDELLGPYGLRFSVFAIDGAIDEVKMRTMFPDQPTSFFIQPDDIALELERLFEADDLPLTSGISGESSFAKR